MERNSFYIDLKDFLKQHKHKLSVNPLTIRKVLEDLHMDEDEEITISGTYTDWGWFLNHILSQVLEEKDLEEDE